MTAPIRVAIADDQVLFCSGIEMMIRSQSDLEFVGSAYDGTSAVSLAESSKPDIFLMDVRMPETDGISATRQILSLGPPARVIVLTTPQRDIAVIAAIDAGARGFLMKDSTPEFLLATIRSVHLGHTVVAPATPEALIRDVPTTRRQPNEDVIRQLSRRERTIFLLAAQGLSTSEIAERAYVTESTVKSHISNILSKLGLTSRVQLVALAHTNDLIP